MFFGNPSLLERTLHNDLNVLIKNVKLREDQHLTLLQHNKAAIAQLSQLDSIPFLQEEVLKQKGFYASLQADHESVQQEERELVEKYACTFSGEANVGKLLTRMTARIVQISSASLEKSKFFDESLVLKQKELKDSMCVLIGEEKIDLEALFDKIISYFSIKNAEEMKKLNQIIRILIQGDLGKLQEVYKPYQNQEQQKKPIKDEQLEKKKLIQKKEEKKRILKIREQNRNAEKNRKQKIKLVSRMTSMYSTMEISKQQLNEDMIFRNPQEQRRKLYEDIMSRNKINHEQILQFQSKKEEFEKKVSVFKEMMQREKRKIEEALRIAQQKKAQVQNVEEQTQAKVIQHEKGSSLVKSEADEVCEIVIPERQKPTNQKGQCKESPRLTKQMVTSMQSTQENFQHLRFDKDNQQVFPRSNRAKLPQISGRSSLESRFEKQKSLRGNSEMKEEKRVSIMKNINIGSFQSVTAKNSSMSYYESNRKFSKEKSPEPKLFEINFANGSNQVIGGFDFTFYGRKKGHLRANESNNEFIL